MMYKEIVWEFATRSKKNLEAIDRLKKEGAEVFEATQLVNSMLGLLVLPHERFFDGIPDIPISDLEQSGWPTPRVRPPFQQATDLRQLVRYLRNAIVHFNVEFHADSADQIGSIKVWNADPETGRQTWKAQLEINELRGIAERLIDLLLEYGNSPGQ